MKNIKYCNEKDWFECCKCGIFDFCELKEANRQGIFDVANRDLRDAFQHIKRKILNFKFKKVKLSGRNKIRK